MRPHSRPVGAVPTYVPCLPPASGPPEASHFSRKDVFLFAGAPRAAIRGLSVRCLLALSAAAFAAALVCGRICGRSAYLPCLRPHSRPVRDVVGSSWRVAIFLCVAATSVELDLSERRRPLPPKKDDKCGTNGSTEGQEEKNNIFYYIFWLGLGIPKRSRRIRGRPPPRTLTWIVF